MPTICRFLHCGHLRINYLEATVRDQRGGKGQFVNGSGGYLMMRRPGEMRLRANKAGIGTVLDAGASNQFIWLVAPPAGKAWWANRQNIGKACMQAMPIDPLAVMQVTWDRRNRRRFS